MENNQQTNTDSFQNAGESADRTSQSTSNNPQKDETPLAQHNDLESVVSASYTSDGSYQTASNPSQIPNKEFENAADYSNSQNYSDPPNSTQSTQSSFVETESQVKCRLKTYKTVPTRASCLQTFLDSIENEVIEILTKNIEQSKAVKFNVFMEVTFFKDDKNGDHRCDRNLKTANEALYLESNLKTAYTAVKEKLTREKSECELKESGWSFLCVKWLELRVNKFNALKGCSFIELPKSIRSKKAVVNVKNEDEFCFKYAIWAHNLSLSNNKNKVSSYLNDPDFHRGYKWDCVSYPVKIADITKFEKANNMSINVFGVGDEEKVFPMKVSETELPDHRDLLFLSDENGSHYAWIVDFGKLVGAQISKGKRKCYVCKKCFTTFDKRYGGEEKLKRHKSLCFANKTALIKMPPRDGRLRFKNFIHSQRVPFAIYADLECILKPIQEPNTSSTGTTQTHEHEVAAYGYYIKDVLDEHSIYRSYRGKKGVVVHFLNSLKIDLKQIISLIYEENLPMEDLSEIEKREFEEASICHICGEGGFDPKDSARIKVKDHDHRTQKYRGPAHASCNMAYKNPKFVPVFMHNFSGYDSHFIVKELGCISGSITAISESTEKFISFSVKIDDLELRFLDSLRFMPSKLSELADNLPKEQYKAMRQFFPKPDEFDLLTQKGIFPYEYMTCHEKMSEKCLPTIENFYSNLTEEDISPSDYERAQDVWKAMKIRNLGEYTDLYCKTDVLILADVFENFREICMEAYSLDPVWYYSAPGLAFSAMLKCTNINLELLSDYDMLLFVEQGKRGGLCQCIKRYATANNRYLKGYDPDTPSSFILYLDANNLYGWAMSECLPTGNFQWMSDEELSSINISELTDDSEEGYFLEVDIEYGQHLHDSHSDLPFCPEASIVPGTNQVKLLTTLNSKKNYVAHFRTLKQALEHGLKVVKIHRGLKFSQSKWLAPYISLNTEKRKLAKNEFEKNFYKLMNNSVFGKCMENIRKRTQVELVSGEKRLDKLIAKPNFMDRTILKREDENGNFLVMVHLGISKLVFNKPIYVGTAILDISKEKMYSFHYDEMKKIFSEICILYMDTDSFFYEVKTDDVYDDMLAISHLLDTSGYKEDHKLYSKQNKKVLGKFKDELNGEPIYKFAGLRPKMYSYRQDSGDAKKAKGVKKATAKRQIRFEDYESCILDKMSFKHTSHSFRSKKHQVTTIQSSESSLNGDDNKRVVLDDNVYTLPYGHYTLSDSEPSAKKIKLS